MHSVVRLPEHLPEPVPSFDKIGAAWKTVFANLGIFLPPAVWITFIELAVGGLALGFEAILGFPSDYENYTPVQWISSQLISVSSGILLLGPLYATAYAVAFNVLDKHEAPLRGIQSFKQLYSPVMIYCASVSVVSLGCSLASRLLVKPMFEPFVDIALEGFVTYPLVLVIPAIVRFGLSPWEATKFSLRRVGKKPLAYLAFSIVAFIVSLSGLIACIFGVVLTMFVGYVAIAMLLHPIGAADENSPFLNPHSQYPRYPDQPSV